MEPQKNGIPLISFDFVITNGIKLHVATAGPENGKPIILLHGFPDFWYGWKSQIEYLASHGFRVFAPDQRGFNLSDKPKGAKSYTVDKLVEDIIGLADNLQLEKFFLGGHDFGGYVSWALATKFPDRIIKLVVANIPHPLVMNRYMKQHKEQRKKSWYIYFFQIPFLPELFSKSRDWASLRGSMSRTLKRHDFNIYKKAWSQPKAMTSMINWYRAMRRKSSFKWLIPPQITVPTLIIWGKQDAFLSYQMGEKSVEICTQGKIEYFDDASHWVLQEKAEQVNRLIEVFFTQ